MAKIDPHVLSHLEWLGFVRPTGLVVSAPALVRAGAILEQRDTEGQQRLRACLAGDANAVRETAAVYGAKSAEIEPRIRDFREFAAQVLEWRFTPTGYAGTPEAPIPPELEVTIPGAGVTLRPDYAIRELEPQNGAPPWQLLVQVISAGQDFDRETGGRLELSPHSRMERLLRQTGVPAGLLVNGEALRLVSAPRRESSGWLDFRIADMVQTAGRPICTALRLLLAESRLLSLPRAQRLAALLADSRKFQNEVSEQLAEQVLHALYELLRGFQAADDASHGELLRPVLAGDPDEVYRALLTVILRLVFLLYAEERDLLPQNETFLRYYSLAGLHERVREDAALYPDTMDQRYGAWAQLVALFRMVHDGAHAEGLRLPPRHGVLFDPDRFPFLEGRSSVMRDPAARIEPPLVPDGTIFRALEKLRVLEGERISYRALDVEQIGSVYETMMGFRLETATGRSVAIKSAKRQGAPTALDLDAILAAEGSARAKMIQERTDRKLTDRVKNAVRDATTLDALHAALLPVIDLAATPDLVPPGAMVLQPSEARRRSGSHYTPRELTAPIVHTTLDPILERLRGADGTPPRPEAILELKVCDPAMGSGAFLVEACRYLGDALLAAWRAHGEMPPIPPDENEVIYAQRIIAQRCLYGVDRNPVAVDLAKMSLWLATLAKDHPLTFIDHALRHGDSLVGFSRQQIESFGGDTRQTYDISLQKLRAHVARVVMLRQRIREADETVPDERRRALWEEAQSEVEQVRFSGDLAVAAFFDAAKPRERERKRLEYVSALERQEAENLKRMLAESRHADPPLAPFHWEIEFPEVFDRERPGFDAFVGNPPFVGGRKVRGTVGDSFFDWLADAHAGSSGNADLVAHFFRRAFDLLRTQGAFGLIATNTIAQGDTRASGLRWICEHGGEIFAARRRVPWPGQAAVIVSVVHVIKGSFAGIKRLDGREVDKITAFLFHRGGNDDPMRLVENAGRSFQGSIVLGMGFTFDDTDTSGVATPIADMNRLIAEKPRNQEVIFPYIGGEEVNTSPTHAHHRYVIDFRDRSEDECRHRWPELMALLDEKVKPERTRLDSNGEYKLREPLPTRWWHHADKRPALYAAIAGLERVLVICRHQPNWGVAFLPGAAVFAESTIVFPFSRTSVFSVLQSRPHEIWARFFGSSFGDGLRYTPSDCFETFSFPSDWETNAALETAGKAYYEFRAALMIRNNEGLTKTYNRFHDPDETSPDIHKLRELHAAMDRAALDAYGWTDVPTRCEFLLDYEIDEEEWGDKKKPYRYRWPDEVQEEVLARLLELNAERARAQVLAGETGAKRGKRGTKKRVAAPDIKDLFS